MRAPRAAHTLPTTQSPVEKNKVREKDREKQEKHSRLHLRTHFPHPHLHALSTSLHPESNHHRSRSHDHRHRRTQTDTYTPTILINDSVNDIASVASLAPAKDGSPSDINGSHHQIHHHHHHRHTNQGHNSKEDLKTMLRPTRPGVRPRAVSDSSRPSPAVHVSSNPSNAPATTNDRTIQRTPTTASFISSVIDRNSALKKLQLESATPATLAGMRKSAAEADAELRSRLTNISKSSNEITRRLDYTYYNLLEKLGQLGSTVSSFQSLLAQTHAMNEEFRDGISDRRGSSGLQADLTKGAEDFEISFEGREKRVEELEERIRNGRDRGAELGKRLEDCREKIKEFDMRERKWREKVSWRLRIFWVCSALLLCLALGFGVWWENRGIRVSESRLNETGKESGNETLSKVRMEKEEFLNRISAETVPEDVQELLRNVVARQEKALQSSKDSKVPMEAGERKGPGIEDGEDVLRIFDEL